VSEVGRPVLRKEDLRLLTGSRAFHRRPQPAPAGACAMVRSPHPHARIVRVDTARALAMPGVLGVYTGADCAADGLAPIPHHPLPATREDMKLAGPGGGAIFEGRTPCCPPTARATSARPWRWWSRSRETWRSTRPKPSQWSIRSYPG